MTVEAAVRGIADVKKEADADQRIVFLVSDANLRRYGISPATLGTMTNDSLSCSCVTVAVCWCTLWLTLGSCCCLGVAQDEHSRQTLT